jgi:hypothetical protein
VRKCALPVHDFRVPKGCSTVCLQIIMASGRCKAGLHFVEDAFVTPALELLVMAGEEPPPLVHAVLGMQGRMPVPSHASTCH